MLTEQESPIVPILKHARELVAQGWSVRDAVYESAVNGESDSCAMKCLEDAGLQFGVYSQVDVLTVFDKAIEQESAC